MKDLEEIQFDRSNIVLGNNRVKGAILPKVSNELDRNIEVQKDTIVEGAIFASTLDIKNGDAEFQGAVFAQQEVHIDGAATGTIIFRKSVAAIESVVSHARNVKLIIASDVNAKNVRLTNAFISGSIFADSIDLYNCVVCGGIFASKEATIKNSIVGTFNAPSVRLDEKVMLLLPSAFSLEPLKFNQATTSLINLSLADLGSLYCGQPQLQNSGAVKMNIESDELYSTLKDEERQMNVRCYSIIGKVLAADLLDWDKMRNHFLLSGASLNSQLLTTYDLGEKVNGEKAELTMENLYDFFFEILSGKLQIQELSNSFSLEELQQKFL